MLRSLHTGPDGEIQFSGNPNKFLHGHNLFGSDDLIALMSATLEKVFRALDIHPTEENWTSLNCGQYTLSRIDLNTMYELPSLSDVLAWIRAAANSSRSRHKSSGALRGDTLYHGKNSRRWSLKIYSKGQEIAVKGHELPEDLENREELIAWAKNKLRVELTLRSGELKQIGLKKAVDFYCSDLCNLLQSYRNRITLADNFALSSELLEMLPHRLRCTYLLWERGEDLRGKLSKNTFYNHRRQLLAHGVDIAVKQVSDRDYSVPLLKVFETAPSDPLTI